jgi:hypothetical protein
MTNLPLFEDGAVEEATVDVLGAEKERKYTDWITTYAYDP